MISKPKIFYFHGAPGAVVEAALIQHLTETAGFELHAIDRFAINAASDEEYLQAIAGQIQTISQGGEIIIFAFSIGAMIAIKTLALLEQCNAKLFLFSPAVPQDLAVFGEKSAGSGVFELAKSNDFAFKALTYFEGILAKFAPSFLRALLFANVQRQEAKLLQSPEFAKNIDACLKHSFVKKPTGYCRDIKIYANAASQDLSNCVGQEVTIYHGSADAWSPPQPIEKLAQTLGAKAILLDNHGHYSALLAGVPLAINKLQQS